MNTDGDLFNKKEGYASSQWECPRDFVAPYPSPLGSFNVQDTAPADTMHSTLYRHAIKLEILKDRGHIGNILKGLGVEHRGYPVERFFQLSTVARAPLYTPNVCQRVNEARDRLGLSSLVFHGTPWQLVARPDRSLSETGSCYFWHPPTNREARTLPDLTWVNVDPAILPRPEGQEPLQSPEGQYLYIDDFKHSALNWWLGVLQQWEVTKLTGSAKRGLLLDLSMPLLPRFRSPRNRDIPEDPDDLDDDDEESQPDTNTVFYQMD